MRVLAIGAAAALIVAAALVADDPGLQHPRLLGPFLSGAANFEPGEGWRYAREDVRRFAELPSNDERMAHRFGRRPDAELTPYPLSSKGLLYVVWAARNVLFWMGDAQALEWVQIALHCALTILVALHAGSPRLAFLFVLLYGLNPLVLRVVTFPYYYAWQAVPTAIVAAYLLDPKLRLGLWSLGVALVLALVYAIRPTGVLVSGFLFVLVARRESLRLGAASLALFAAVAFGVLSDSQEGKDPWHTAYIGIGAYPNPYVPDFRDRVAFEEYARRTGERVDLELDGNYFDPAFRKRLSDETREAYLEIARRAPWLILRNAVLNYFQSFSIGYVSLGFPAALASAALGLLFFAALLWKRRFAWLAAISLAGATFVPYTPPNHLYMFGNYALLVAAFVDLLRVSVPSLAFAAGTRSARPPAPMAPPPRGDETR